MSVQWNANFSSDSFVVSGGVLQGGELRLYSDGLLTEFGVGCLNPLQFQLTIFSSFAIVVGRYLTGFARYTPCIWRMRNYDAYAGGHERHAQLASFVANRTADYGRRLRQRW